MQQSLSHFCKQIIYSILQRNEILTKQRRHVTIDGLLPKQMKHKTYAFNGTFFLLLGSEILSDCTVSVLKSTSLIQDIGLRAYSVKIFCSEAYYNHYL